MDAVSRNVEAGEGVGVTMTPPEILRAIRIMLGDYPDGRHIGAGQIRQWQALIDEAVAELSSLQTRFDDEVARSLNLHTDLLLAKQEIVRMRNLAIDMIAGPAQIDAAAEKLLRQESEHGTADSNHEEHEAHEETH